MSVTTGSIGSMNELPTEEKLRKFHEEEEGDMIVMEFCQDLMNNVMERIQADSLVEQAQNFVVNCAIEALKKAVEVYYCTHNTSYTDMGKESWKPDESCEPSPPDSWAAYRAPVTYDRESDDVNMNKEVESKLSEEKPRTHNFDVDEIEKRFQASISQSSSSQDEISMVDYLDEIVSTSSEEEEDEVDYPSWIDEIPMDQLSQRSARLSEKLSQLSGRVVYSENLIMSPDTEKFTSSAFSKTALGEAEKGLCIPHVANLPVSNVLKDVPEIEEYVITKVEKRKTKVSKRALVCTLPRRRSDTKLKMAAIVEEPVKDKSRERKKTP